MANRRRANLLPLCRHLVEANPQQQVAPLSEISQVDKQPAWLCPLCGGPMVVIEMLTAQRIQSEFSKQREYVDTS
jgi:hypothetical protein